ncbi:hypothetical protein O3M35_008825 [Rhynocoris fuscipes]|uniref:Uncharacterized protein n=1 Tax=Rhynocoris fuscipes TaxID=488301 RepID=A0AAW1D954_9HEMI
MSEVGKRNCTDGIIYSCCDPGDNIEPTKYCWDTGCQLNSWSVKGCEQYGRKETGRRSCDGGIIYTCCATGGSGFGPNTVDFI